MTKLRRQKRLKGNNSSGKRSIGSLSKTPKVLTMLFLAVTPVRKAGDKRQTLTPKGLKSA